MMKKAKKITKQSSPAIRAAKYGITASRVFLQDMASLLGHVAYAGQHNYHMGWAEYEDLMDERDARKAREHLRYLARQKLIETRKIGEKLMVRLTAKGSQQILRDKIRCTTSKSRDGMCVVVFDVPESERRVRDTLRWILQECGFSMIQKSVWATDKDVLNELCALLQGADLQQWVRIMIGNEIRQSKLQRATTRLTAR